jgi:DNA invertase Pin-like site-specific DNA recombinase
MIYGYARVSTDGQTLDAQLAELKAAGAERVFRETASGATTDRRRLARAIETLGEGDVLLVTRLDRLARSTREALPFNEPDQATDPRLHWQPKPVDLAAKAR